MDQKDVQIIRALQKDARLTNQDLSEQVNLSPSPCLRRLRLLEKKGVLKGYTALVDQKAYGLPLTVFTQIKLHMHNKDAVQAFEDRVMTIPEIMDCYIITGGSDYLLRVLCKDLDGYEFFVRETLQNLPGIASIDTSFAYSVVKQSHVYPEI
ncbi:MAG: Lrp/AsnC family transcriptional regulator [Methylocystaceae bacterium]|nr:Lrp/AsnC family transcriptional regulator [Methylocystaceae bacterium]